MYDQKADDMRYWLVWVSMVNAMLLGNNHDFKDVYFSMKQKLTLYVEFASKYLRKEEIKG